MTEEDCEKHFKEMENWSEEDWNKYYREVEKLTHEWENVVYPRLWHKAYDAGLAARNAGLPRICDLTDSELCHNGKPLRIWKQVWEQGWDKWSIPSVFKEMEDKLKQMPLKPLEEI